MVSGLPEACNSTHTRFPRLRRFHAGRYLFLWWDRRLRGGSLYGHTGPGRPSWRATAFPGTLPPCPGAHLLPWLPSAPR